MEAQQSFLQLAACLAIQMGCNKSQSTAILYQRLSLSLVRANARALLTCARFQGGGGGGGVAAVTLILLVCCTVYVKITYIINIYIIIIIF